MATSRKLHVGSEDTLTEIDTNADGTTDVYVLTDSAPQGAPASDPPPFGPFELGQGSTPDPDLLPGAHTWRDRRTS